VSDEKDAKAPKKKKGLIGKMMPVLIGLVLGAGGVGGGLYAVKPEAFKAAPAKSKKAEAAHEEEGEEKESKYFALSQPFTSNLKDSQQFVQLSISLGTYRDEAFVETLKTHEMALRSAALLTIADQTYDQVATSEGKAALAAKLKDVLNKALKERGAAPGIDTVYFTGFVVQ
jgi:flagellar protein FliL